MTEWSLRTAFNSDWGSSLRQQPSTRRFRSKEHSVRPAVDHEFRHPERDLNIQTTMGDATRAVPENDLSLVRAASAHFS